jgi:hypothetical protein
MTVAPAQRASWMAALPTAPAPPATRTAVSRSAPGRSRAGPSSATVSARWAVTPGIPTLAPSSKSAPSGSGKARSAGTTVNSWAVPLAGRPSAARVTQTRSPGAIPVTPGPTASTTPAPSWLGTVGSPTAPPKTPLRDFQSVGLTPDTITRIRTSPSPGSAIGRSTTRRTDVSPALA